MRFGVVKGGVARGGEVEAREGYWEGEDKSATTEAGRLDLFCEVKPPAMIIIIYNARKCSSELSRGCTYRRLSFTQATRARCVPIMSPHLVLPVNLAPRVKIFYSAAYV